MQAEIYVSHGYLNAKDKCFEINQLMMLSVAINTDANGH